MTVGLPIALQLALTGRIDPLVAAVRVPWSSLTVVLISWRAYGFPGAGRCA